MKVVYGLGRPVKVVAQSVAAIGVFDAVHRGHQRVIQRAVSEAKRLRAKSVVVTFDPHPVAVVHPQAFKKYVLTLEHRLSLIEACGADICFVIRFDARFARMSAQDFVEKVLVDQLGVCKVVVGGDFHFGHDRSGSFSLLSRMGKRHGFVAEKILLKKYKNINIKTKYIKNLISLGDLKALESFLARPYSMFAEVVKGDGRGKRLGFPTANLKKENVVTLPSGIYCVRVTVHRKKCPGVFYIGTRPSFKSSQSTVSLEAHLFDFSGNLYGRKILVEFLKKVRNDMTFSDEKSLIQQMDQDVAFAKKFFRTTASC